MDRRSITQTVARNVRSAATAAGVTNETLAQATGTEQREMDGLLNGDAPFTLPQLFSVGGFLRIPAHSFLQEVAA